MDKKDDLKRELDRLLAIPTEPRGEPNVIWFQKQFANSPKVYTYAAVETAGLWFVTGTTAMPGKTWADLLDWIGEDTKIWLASGYELIT